MACVMGSAGELETWNADYRNDGWWAEAWDAVARQGLTNFLGHCRCGLNMAKTEHDASTEVLP